MNDIILNVVIGIVTGFVSGLISGVAVTHHFKKKDMEQEAKSELSRKKQDLSTYLTAIRMDLDKLSGDLKKEELVEVHNLRKALNSVPHFSIYETYFKNSSQEAKEPTIRIYKLIQELDAYLQSNELKSGQILKFKAGLFMAQFDMLKNITYSALKGNK